MTASNNAHHQLRLVGTHDTPAMNSWRAHSNAQQAIEAENRNAAVAPDLNPTDPRWVLAVRAHSQLEGSTLTPERRKRLLRTADALGIRPFDANVIVAIVQDRARRGESLGSARDMIAMTPTTPRGNEMPLMWKILLALSFAAVMAVGIGKWIIAG